MIQFFDKTKTFEKIKSQLAEKSVELLSLKQVHGGNVLQISSHASIHVPADGFFTDKKNLALSIHTADCLPVLISAGAWIGACHAGWRGITKGILENLVLSMEKAGAKKGAMKISFGPSICGKCFEVGNDVADLLCEIDGKTIESSVLSKIRFPHEDSLKSYIDLKQLSLWRMMRLGMAQNQFEILDTCTYENQELFYSFRRDGDRGRIESVINFLTFT